MPQHRRSGPGLHRSRPAASAGADVRAWTMEDHVERPVTSFPRPLVEEVRRFRPTASFFIGTGLVGELGFRKPMLTLLADELRCRHGHMIGIDDQLMTDGMAVDYGEVCRVPRKVFDVVQRAEKRSGDAALGPDLVDSFA